MSIIDYAREKNLNIDRFYFKTNNKRKFLKELDNFDKKYRSFKNFNSIEVSIKLTYYDEKG